MWPIQIEEMYPVESAIQIKARNANTRCQRASAVAGGYKGNLGGAQVKIKKTNINTIEIPVAGRNASNHEGPGVAPQAVLQQPSQLAVPRTEKVNHTPPPPPTCNARDSPSSPHRPALR